MAVSPLLIKGICGTGAIAVIGTGGVYLYREEIFGTVEKEIIESANKTDGWETEEKTTKKQLIIKSTNTKNTKRIKNCVINLKDNSTLKTTLEGKIKTSTPTEKRKKYRRGLLRVCFKNNWQLDEKTTELNNMFDFSKEKLTNKESELKTSEAWTVSEPTLETNNQKITATITITNTSENEINVGSCKIIGTKSGSTIEDGKKSNLKSDIEAKIGSTADATNKPKWRENFLKKCKQSYEEEIHLTLSEDSTRNNNYKFEKLEKLFNGTL